MSKRRHGEGCWDSISVKGITYKRFRIDGQSFTGKTEKACKAKWECPKVCVNLQTDVR